MQDQPAKLCQIVDVDHAQLHIREGAGQDRQQTRKLFLDFDVSAPAALSVNEGRPDNGYTKGVIRQSLQCFLCL